MKKVLDVIRGQPLSAQKLEIEVQEDITKQYFSFAQVIYWYWLNFCAKIKIFTFLISIGFDEYLIYGDLLKDYFSTMQFLVFRRKFLL